MGDGRFGKLFHITCLCSKNAREANLLVVGLVDWRALVLSLKEALTQP